MEMVGAPPPEPGCTLGTGIWPPARKLAVSPDRAIKSGSAKLLTRFFDSSALISSSILTPWVLTMLANKVPNGVVDAAAPANVPAIPSAGWPFAPVVAELGDPGTGGVN